jgi:Asp-tRNA(Asn)/Glu-tRNA(Gln) amidotransferase A subunit family amidase
MSEEPQNVRSTVESIARGDLSSKQWVDHCLSRIESNKSLGCWSFIDADRARERADQLDSLRKDGSALGKLHGCPIGLKDIIEVKDMPHGCGSPAMGQISTKNATLVDALESAGAVIIGKTETAEFASLHPARTKNPHKPAHSPGGSSAGSAAAVAAGDVPLAIGSQTNGSTIRPASYCGVFGMKPSAGIIPRTGVFEQSPTLDQMGVFASSLEDIALLIDCVSVHDSRDPHSIDFPRPSCLDGFNSAVPMEPKFAAFTLPYRDRQSPDCTEGFHEVLASLGSQVEILEAPSVFNQLIQAQRVIQLKESVVAFDTLGLAAHPALSDTLNNLLSEGRKVSSDEYQEALSIRDSLDQFFGNFFDDFDAILSPSATGEAPILSEGHTGDPIFCTIWTLAGLPALNLPILQGENDLPIGVQMIGRKRDDARLLRTAHWFIDSLIEEGDD